jgi:hypothetical protein
VPDVSNAGRPASASAGAATRIAAAARVAAAARATATARATAIWAIAAGTSTRRSATGLAATTAVVRSRSARSR